MAERRNENSSNNGSSNSNKGGNRQARQPCPAADVFVKMWPWWRPPWWIQGHPRYHRCRRKTRKRRRHEVVACEERSDGNEDREEVGVEVTAGTVRAVGTVGTVRAVVLG